MCNDLRNDVPALFAVVTLIIVSFKTYLSGPGLAAASAVMRRSSPSCTSTSSLGRSRQIGESIKENNRYYINNHFGKQSSKDIKSNYI